MSPRPAERSRADRPAASGVDRGSFGVRLAVLAVVGLAPLAFGGAHEPTWLGIVLLGAGAGLLSRVLALRAPRLGEPRLPGAWLLLAFHAVVIVQLVPLPPGLLRIVGPGSFEFHQDAALLPLAGWRPLSVSPTGTLRGLASLTAMSLLYAASFRELRSRSWARRLAATVVAAALLATVAAFVQTAGGERRIYGLWRPADDWAVFGPYLNRNQFAGFVVMAIPLAMALAADALGRLGRSWPRRGWVALGDPAGLRAVWGLGVAIVLVAGLVASQSRGGFVAFLVGAAALPLVARRRRRLLAVVVPAVVVATSWIGVEGILRGFEVRGVRASRFDLWLDASRMLGDFPWFGAGFNAFGVAYVRYQEFWRSLWVQGVHNEYLQVFLDTGLVGGPIALAFLARLLLAAARGAREGPLRAGLLAALVGECVQNTVDVNWQNPANAAVFAALAGLAAQEPGRTDSAALRG